jgi:hypothetical protein
MTDTRYRELLRQFGGKADVMTLMYWRLDPPKQWQAGSYGANKTPIYFACADCRTKDATIAGILSKDGTYSTIGILGTFDAMDLRPAMFCGPCFDHRVREADTAREAADRVDAQREEDNDPIDDETGQRTL